MNKRQQIVTLALTAVNAAFVTLASLTHGTVLHVVTAVLAVVDTVGSVYGVTLTPTVPREPTHGIPANPPPP